MYTVLVKYVLPKPTPRATMVDNFKAAEERFRSVPDLLRKYFAYDEAEHTGHSVYLWKSEKAARDFFNDEFIALFKEKFGTTPELFYVDTLMVVDNEAGHTTLNG
ncbi:MAG: hypothetical protein ACR2P9_07805 [Gammaproteobacteria bacterium]